VRDQFRAPMAPLRQGQQWLIDIVHILDAPLPAFDAMGKPPRPGQAAKVQQQLNDYLAELQATADLSDWLATFRQHLIGITTRWGDDLFVCYDIVGLPATNNALESRFGRLRRDQRRITGRQHNTATLLDEGPYLIWECGTSEAQVLARLRRVAANRVDYQRRYQTLCAEQARRRLIYRLQHHQLQAFRELEAAWTELHSHKTV
jgi:uncharacterized membrane protein